MIEFDFRKLVCILCNKKMIDFYKRSDLLIYGGIQWNNTPKGFICHDCYGHYACNVVDRWRNEKFMEIYGEGGKEFITLCGICSKNIFGTFGYIKVADGPELSRAYVCLCESCDDKLNHDKCPTCSSWVRKSNIKLRNNTEVKKNEKGSKETKTKGDE